LQVSLERNGTEPGDLSIESLQKELQDKLTIRAQAEAQLMTVRHQVEQFTENLRNLEQSRDELAQVAENMRNELQRLQLNLQTYAVRCASYEEQIIALEYQLETIVLQLPLESTIETAAMELQSISNRIQRLGAINLLAIEEEVVQEERATYLDAQFAD
jgi:chromosome segregation protein